MENYVLILNIQNEKFNLLSKIHGKKMLVVIRVQVLNLLHHFVVSLLILICSLSILFIYLSIGRKNFSRKNLIKTVWPWENQIYGLRLLMHLSPTTNTTRLLSQLPFEILQLVLLRQRGLSHVRPKSAVRWLATWNKISI